MVGSNDDSPQWNVGILLCQSLCGGYLRILQGQVIADRHSTGLGASDNRDITDLERRAVALACWYGYIQRLSLPRSGTEVARHDKGNAVSLPETFYIAYLG